MNKYKEPKARKVKGGVMISDVTNKARSVVFGRDIHIGVEYITVRVTDEDGESHAVRMTRQQCLDLEGLL